MDSEKQVFDGSYVLRDSAEETERLISQNQWLARALDYNNGPVSASLDLRAVSNVMDVAAGALSWTLDFASIPGVHKRLQHESENRISLYACDISSRKFPPTEVTDRLGVKTFVHDLVEPFPREMKDSFDLIHMRLVIYALTRDGWPKALSNLSEILKPGGLLYMVEPNIGYLFPVTLPTGESKSFGCVRPSQDGTSWIHKYNQVHYTFAGLNNFVPRISSDIEGLLNDTCLEMVSNEQFAAPAGKLCDKFTSPAGNTFTDMVDITTHQNVIVFDQVTKALVKGGITQLPSGLQIGVEEKRAELVKEFATGLNKEGSFVIMNQFVIRKA